MGGQLGSLPNHPANQYSHYTKMHGNEQVNMAR